LNPKDGIQRFKGGEKARDVIRFARVNDIDIERVDGRAV
jgi:hypothetical protein